jgi:hypothetical protein
MGNNLLIPHFLSVRYTMSRSRPVAKASSGLHGGKACGDATYSPTQSVTKSDEQAQRNQARVGAAALIAREVLASVPQWRRSRSTRKSAPTLLLLALRAKQCRRAAS